jgi:hypothetical protein
VGGLAILVIFVGGMMSVHPFLAANHPVQARYLVVEGWLPDYALEAAAREFQEGHYEKVITTGGPLDYGSLLVAYESYAACAAASLPRFGLVTNDIVVVPSREKYRNRTFSSALALRAFGEEHHLDLGAINVLSLGAHARRTQLCFKRALGDGTQVGIISVPNRDYDSDRWWKFSEGLKTVGGECIGFSYAWLALDYGH